MSPRLARCEWQPEMFFRPLGRTEKQLPVGFFRETAHSALILALFLSFGAILKWRLHFFCIFGSPSPQSHNLTSFCLLFGYPLPPLHCRRHLSIAPPLLFSPLLSFLPPLEDEAALVVVNTDESVRPSHAKHAVHSEAARQLPLHPTVGHAVPGRG